MRAGRLAESDSLTRRVGDLIKQASTRSLSDLNKEHTSSKDLWSKVNQIIGKVPPNIQSSKFEATKFNEHYATVSLDPAYTSPLPKLTCPLPSSWPSEFAIFRCLDSLKRTSPGPDQIPYWFLKLGAPYLSAPISLLYQLSLNNSIVPSQWKTATIIPTPKLPTPQTYSDFRPISHTPLLSRILERLLVRHYLYPLFSDTREPINSDLADQFAFRPTGSTTATLISILKTITDLLATEPFVRLITFDFSKAFDSLSHSSLFVQIEHLPIPDNLYNWLIQFFNNRTHSTFFGGLQSSTLHINCSVVQGSGLGPAKYIIKASSLKPLHAPNTMCKYADDTYLIIPASSDQTANAEVSHVIQWAHECNLKVNMSKCQDIILHRISKLPQAPPLLAGHIPRVTELTALGVVLHETLSMSPHITKISKRASQTLYALRVLRAHGLSGKQLHLVTRAHLESRIGYAISAWAGFASQADIDRVQKIINKATRWGLDGGFPLPSILTIANNQDKRLFARVLRNPGHVLHSSLPPINPQTHSLRPRSHNRILTVASTLSHKNFMTRMLFSSAY